jgi:hypothetical protein
MLMKLVLYSGKPMAVMCDAKCEKAFGINGRPQTQFDPDDEDDNAYLPDDQVGIAPDYPGTWEGGEGKPLLPEQRMNKWCVRECERSVSADMGEVVELPDFSKPVYNMPWKHPESQQ